MIAPEYVVVDTIDGYVFTNDGTNKFLTKEQAFTFGKGRNKELKQPTYRVFKLTEVQEDGQ